MCDYVWKDKFIYKNEIIYKKLNNDCFNAFKGIFNLNFFYMLDLI
jgi:hypothetical protein